VLVRAHGFAIQRGIAEHTIVELDVRPGLPAFSVIGLTGGAARDARERVQAAVLNSGLSVPRKRVTVNLAPASSRRGGSEFDLAIACCVVAADGVIDSARLARVGLFGELGLGGLLRPCAGISAAAVAAGEAGLDKLIVALPDLENARSARALPVAGKRDLSEVVALLATRQPLPARPPDPRSRAPVRRAPQGTIAGRAGGRAQVDGTLVRGAGGSAGVGPMPAPRNGQPGRGNGAQLPGAGARRERPP
jgi:magnesium chelatase family protein